MIKKVLFLLATGILTSVIVKAQDADKAKEILDKVSEKTKSFKTIKADFSFTLENLQEDITETYDGSIKIKGNKYAIDLMDAKTYFDGKTLYTFMPETEEVNVSEPDENEDGTINPAKIFSLYESGFKYRFIGEPVIDGKTLYEIDLYPESRDKPFSRIKLFIYKDNLTLESLKQMGKDGNNYIIKVKKFQNDLPFDDSEFTFNASAHPDVEVIDMR